MYALRKLFVLGVVVFRLAICVIPASADAAHLDAAPAAVAGTADPTLLPVANVNQFPLTAVYNALNVPAIAAGGSYLDPLTAVKVYKVTSAAFPTGGFSWGHDYA